MYVGALHPVGFVARLVAGLIRGRTTDMVAFLILHLFLVSADHCVFRLFSNVG